MYNRLWLPLFTAALLFFAIPPAPAFAQFDIPRFEPAECPVKVPDNRSVDCGYLIAPEDYETPTDRTVSLPVIILRSPGASVSTEALLFTQGGPGGSSMGDVWWLAELDYLEKHDIIILEQRGNLYARPALDCPLSIFNEDSEGSTPCLDSLREQGIDLSLYTTISIAADINSLMQSLDYDAWNLFGTSYSTRPMQVVMQRYPENIRSVLLLSTSPLTDTRYQHDPEHAARVINIMLEDCAANAGCAAAYPDLNDRLYSLIRTLNEQPVTIQMHIQGSDEPLVYNVSGDTLIDWMVTNAFYAPTYPPYSSAYLPLLIQKASAGHTRVFYPWAKEHISHWQEGEIAWGLYFSVNCQDDAASVTASQMEAQAAAYPQLGGFIRAHDELVVCELWDLPPAAPLAAEPVRSDLPTLVMGGKYDPITPPEWGRTALVNLSRKTFVEFPAAGHSVISNNPCAYQIITEFLDNPVTQPDLSCVAGAPNPRFVLPREVIFAPAMYEIHFNELGYSKIEETIFLGALAAMMIVLLVVVLAGIVALFRRPM